MLRLARAQFISYVGNSPVNRADPLGLYYLLIPGSWFDGNGYEGTGGEFYRYQDLEESSMATLDGIIPFADPFGDNGGYDKCDTDLALSRRLGGILKGHLLFHAWIARIIKFRFTE